MAKLFGDDYNGEFSPQGYLSERYRHLATDWNLFQLDSTFKLLRKPSVTGTRLLDLGCGPNLINVIPAPDNFTNIVMADFSRDNLNFIKRWSRGDQSEFTWQHMCDHFAVRHGLGDIWKESRLSTLKSNLQEVVQCDVLQSEPLGPTFTGLFDCVITTFCLETASRDYESYTRGVGNVASLLRSGGHLIMRGILGEESYSVNNKTFHTLSLNLDQVMTALSAAGFSICELILEDTKDESQSFALLAEKNGR